MADAGAHDLEKDEPVVLSWLLSRPDVAKAVDLAMEGQEAEGLARVIKAVESILAAPDAERCSPSPPQSQDCDGDAAQGAATAGVKRGPQADIGPLGAKRPRGAGTGLAKAICIVTSGLHGCGKSALCNTLREVLGGTWLNSDEIASKCKPGESARQSFLHEVRGSMLRALSASDQNRHDRILFVDRSNTTQRHRTDILKLLKKARWRLRGGTVLFVEFVHGSDSFGYGNNGQLSKRHSDQHISICQARVESRGAAQYAGGLRPSPKLRAALKAASKVAEAPSAEEIACLDGRISVEVSLSSPEMATLVIEEIRKLGWLANLRSLEDLQPRIDVAWQAYQRAESQWSASEADAQSERNQWLTQCQQALRAEETAEKAREKSTRTDASRLGSGGATAQAVPKSAPGQPVPLYWKVDLPEVSKVLSQRGLLPDHFELVEKPHTTLLYFGGELDDEKVAAKSNMSVDQLKSMREALEALNGEVFEMKMTKIVMDDHIACGVISLPPILPCVNKVPHVTLGVRQGTPAAYANEVLDEAATGRVEGITTIVLPTPRPLKGRICLEYAAPNDSGGD